MSKATGFASSQAIHPFTEICHAEWCKPFADIPQYEASQEAKLDVPTNRTNGLSPLTLQATENIFRSGFQYYKAGVYAPELVEADLVQTSLFDTPVVSSVAVPATIGFCKPKPQV